VEYLKKAEPIGEQVTQGIRDTVSRILLDVEKEGIAAIRRYSKQLDGWNPSRLWSARRRLKKPPTLSTMS
jgi:sulfopropanediol 3-dehydrogenase